MPAAAQRPDLGVGPVLDQLGGLRVLAEEMLADVGAVARLEGLVVAVDGLVHQLPQLARVVLLEQLVPARAPDQLDHVPAGAAEGALELLDDLAVAPHRPVEPLQVAVDHEDQVVEPLARREPDRPEALRLVHLAVAEEGPDLAVGHVDQAAVVHVFHEPGLVDRHQRPEAHRDGRELPVVGHQPRMRIGRQPFAPGLRAEVVEQLRADPPLHERPGVDAGDRVALEEHQVAAVLVVPRPPEVVEPDVVEHRRRGEGGNMPAVLARNLVAPNHGRHSIPAVDGADAPFQVEVARKGRLLVRRDRVHIAGGRAERQVRAAGAGSANRLVEQEVRAFGAVAVDDILDGFEPFLRLGRIQILRFGHAFLPMDCCWFAAA